MRIFPAEFSQLLSERGRKVAASFVKGRPKPNFTLAEDVFDPATARACLRILDRNIYPLLRKMQSPIPSDSISSMKDNYSEKLPKTLRVKSCHLHSCRCAAYPKAKEINLISLLRSESLLRLAETATGLRLEHNGCQVICYEHGDYAGPHNDHHPESDSMQKGFVDLHIMLSNSDVDHHWIVYERASHLTEIQNVAVQSGVAVYRLPFWHYTTPLAAKPGRERQARRWLLLSSYDIL